MEKVIPFDKGELCYTIEGEGPVVVLLHGFLEDHNIWNTIAKKLSLKNKVITIDLPGFGKSSVFNDIHSMQFMANTVYYVLIEENIDSCVMVGHSMGGYVTLAFAELYPKKVTGIILFHSHAGADDEESKKNRDRTINIVQSDRLGYINSFIQLMFAEKNVKHFEDEIDHLKDRATKTTREGIIAALAGMRDRQDRIGFLKKAEIPVFFIIGKKDSRIPFKKVIAQLEAPQNCEALIIDDVGHLGFIEAEELTYSALEHFVERHA